MSPPRARTPSRPRSGQRAGTALAWSQATSASVVVVTGPEALLAERAVARVREHARGQRGPDMEVVVVEAAAAESGQLATWMSPSLFAEPRCVVAQGVEGASDAFVTDVLAALADLPEDVVLVLRHAGGNRARKVVETALAVPGSVHVDCPALKSTGDLRSFADGEFRAAGRAIAPGAMEALLLAAGTDVAALAAACAQLVADVPAQRIGTDDVDRYYGGHAEVTGFRVADAAVAGHREEALRLLRQALATGLDPVPLVAALAAKLRAMARVSAAGRGPDHELARTLGLAPWQVQRARADLRGWSGDALAAGIIALAEADAAVKGGSRDAAYAVERAVVTLTRAREER